MDEDDIVGDDKLVRRVPSGLVEQQDGNAAFSDVAADLVEVGLHGEGVGERHDDSRADVTRRADRAEQIGVVVALVCGLARACPAPGPLPNLAVLLADPGLVPKPDFDRRRLRQSVEMGLQRARKVFLKASTVRSSWAG